MPEFGTKRHASCCNRTAASERDKVVRMGRSTLVLSGWSTPTPLRPQLGAGGNADGLAPIFIEHAHYGSGHQAAEASFKELFWPDYRFS